MCFDEWGALELKPIGGVAWAPQKQAQRNPATYHRRQGTEQFFGFYDVHADCWGGLFRRRKRLVELCDAFRRLRRCYRRKRRLVILDNLHNTHDHPRFLALRRRLRIRPVGTPTDASWLNLIEPRFGVLKRLTLTNTHDTRHALRRHRIYRYLRYRNRKVDALHHPLNRIRSIRGIKFERH